MNTSSPDVPLKTGGDDPYGIQLLALEVPTTISVLAIVALTRNAFILGLIGAAFVLGWSQLSGP